MMAMRRMFKGVNIKEIRKKANENKDEVKNLPTTMQDFHDAIKKVNKTVTKEDVEKYKVWIKNFGSM